MDRLTPQQKADNLHMTPIKSGHRTTLQTLRLQDGCRTGSDPQDMGASGGEIISLSAQKPEIAVELASMIAHDLNNNLQLVMSSLRLMQRRVRQGHFDDAVGEIERAADSVIRAGALGKRLLACSKPCNSEMSRVEVNSAISSIRPQMDAMFGTSIELSLSLANNLRPIQCDLLGFENVLLNLVINARDAMPAGGTISVKTFSVQLSGNQAPSRAADYVAIVVTDNGEGMAADVISRAFDPYFTTKPAGRGTGLGLASARAFAVLHGGHIEASSAVGEGTSIKIYLPCL